MLVPRTSEAAGRTLDRMMRRLLGGTSPDFVVQSYEGLLDALVIDRADAPFEAAVPLVVADTLMTDRAAARRLAQVTLDTTLEALT